ncbi:putative mscS family protein (plasmid) [Peptoclostridium acidaminophilum DSM 3953]|uniref:Putative mscS family protein n=1 Tax=Peptoclostridium acidaminophilum DSM 3953 TaxID=1286171 RepID=W8T9D5_PEPAC|nr:mechanosensitive ion channel family protein [Peptoclostridium acidaminophilum]AHM57535.1 putative mscS family protein [Peptoclostridium acidaminophilum DSM 3953]
MENLLNVTYFNNSIFNYIMFIVSLAAGIAIIKFVEYVLVRRFKMWSEKKQLPIDDQLILSSSKKIIPFLYLVVFCFSIRNLTLISILESAIKMLNVAASIAIGAMIVSSFSLYFIDKYMENRMHVANSKTIMNWINRIIEVVIWTIALILFLDNIGIKITSLITGLGIGGVAIAFAAQSILVDLFCCFTIFFDKPFEIDDFIVVGEQSGTVEYIGMKTTRLRSLNGEQLILSNHDLTNSRISNYKTMEERRVLFRIGVTYDTPVDKLKEIPKLIENIIEDVQDVKFGRAHFCVYSAYSLDYEIVYYVLNSDYNVYMDINQEINFRIKDEFDRQGIEFAFPTQTLQLYNQSGS